MRSIVALTLANSRAADVTGEVAIIAISRSKRVWTVADAPANLPEVLHRAEAEGPQYIEAAGTFVVTPAEPEQDRVEPELTPGQWLVENAPRGANLEIPDDAVVDG